MIHESRRHHLTGKLATAILLPPLALGLWAKDSRMWKATAATVGLLVAGCEMPFLTAMIYGAAIWCVIAQERRISLDLTATEMPLPNTVRVPIPSRVAVPVRPINWRETVHAGIRQRRAYRGSHNNPHKALDKSAGID